MSTEFLNKENQVLAVRFFGGQGVGAVLQLEVTEAEFEHLRLEPVFQHGVEMCSFSELVETSAAVYFNTAARRNKQARELEDWMAERAGTDFEEVREGVEAKAAMLRAAAKSAVQDSLSIV